MDSECVPTNNDDPRTNIDPSNDDPRTNLDPSNDDSGMTLDSVPVPTDDTRFTTLDSEDALNDNPSLNLDLSIASNSSASQNVQVSPRNDRCASCGVNMRRLRSHQLEIVEVRSVIQQWLLPQQVVISNEDFVCHSCWTTAWNEFRQPASTVTPSVVRLICVSCGRSLRRQRAHSLSQDSPRVNQVRMIISTQIAPRQLQSTSRICHPCWLRTIRAADHESTPTSSIQEDVETISVESTQNTPPVQEASIILPNYSRPPDTQRCCFFPGCVNTERLVVPTSLRVRLFCDFKYYVPPQCRICGYHLRSNSWGLLADFVENPIQTFTAAHIEEFASLLQNNMEIQLNFENIDSIPDHMVHYYLGISKEQFQRLHAAVPSLTTRHRGMFALAAYLIKIRTGDSNNRIASLLGTPRRTIERLMDVARKALVDDFVPRNLGLNHIQRNDISSRNLMIPNALFGGENRNPIIIADGTYIYVEKSSNYLYQKNTYSLHKYRNLVKPFLFVCTDGYIIDVLGPYPATTSDADIINKEFGNENSPYKSYFQNNDVFILDRGFRDAVPLLERLNYSVHVPKSLLPGQTQLTTLDANKSRTVTMCRWVVETINGMFKNCFKIFSQHFFNTASRHFINDFRIAAAIINKFHPRYRDRDDAHEILQVVNANLYRNNDLADFVQERNLNRVRVNFININVLTENIIEFPRLTESEFILFACGTYQIKQARSYYGEHVRANGCYRIEISNDRRTSLFEGSHFGNNCTLFRAKILSRHISGKIYFVYILLRLNVTGRRAIEQYCCNCIVGRRTVGCCAHVMSVVWYLGWARHQTNLVPPADFLNNVLLTYDADENTE